MLCNPHCRKNKRIHCCGSSYKGNRPWLSRYPLCGRQHFHLNTSLHKSEPESGHYEWCWTWFGQTVALLKFLRADHIPMSSLTSGEGGEGSASMGIGMGAVPLGCTCPCSNTGWKGSDPASGEGAQTLPPHTYIPGEHLPGTQVLEKPLCHLLLVECTMVCFHVHSFMLFYQTRCLCAFPQLDLTTWSFPCSFCICILPGGLSSTAEDMDIHRSDGHFSSFLCLLPSQGCGVSSRRGEQGRNSFHWSVLIL